MKRENKASTGPSIKICRSRNSGYSVLAKIILPTSFFLFSITFHSPDSLAATAQGNATLTLHVEQAAVMTINPAASDARMGPERNIRWFSVELTIRMNPGTTASLWVQPISESFGSETGEVGSYFLAGTDMAPASLTAGDHANPIFTVRQNGRHHLTIGVSYPDSAIDAISAQKVEFQLRSSDQALLLSKTM
ncbi:MAG: hypothetical protein A3H27_12665 [Acidobacteria bacterium RIFCSPLOWO2_02_FULL_59_13]|nr:MAG: hypothetical protein A3H27_12665 [Acidobacteria bacterium RIFCSPLOWO2_02_FULL_59_13]